MASPKARPHFAPTLEVHIFLERFSPIAGQVYDFLSAIREPFGCPLSSCKQNIIEVWRINHRYRVTDFSTKSVTGFQKARLSGIPFLVHKHTLSYGNVMPVLKHNKYIVEFSDAAIGICSKKVSFGSTGFLLLKLIQGNAIEFDASRSIKHPEPNLLLILTVLMGVEDVLHVFWVDK
ncbi:uncharacterized protein EV420DRAFT_1480791 [Desarmillaria tabescens]|uniref:Uncharacterized protein n=1 Tax=Armillaria tabescens TaxID=1929756 RepID=A0AA39KCG7_ARMTA|nr:uncharacterized protein EV420DRAFT_1480791 [Desarmillaria tabescens]KAK0457316.1 hypothetical protein EV420DRAFT_1480791 [Desarmillaria tabescens]